MTWPDGNLWRSRIDGSEKLQLTTASVNVESADWSPDGTQIAYTAILRGQKEKLYVTLASAGESRQVAGGEMSTLSSGWTHDGNSLLFLL